MKGWHSLSANNRRKGNQSVTELFNGFNRTAGDVFTGGPTAVLDNLGVLQLSPANVLPVVGGRLSYDLNEGATLGPELAVNGSFNVDTSGWAAPGLVGWSWESDGAGGGRLRHQTGQTTSCYQNPTVTGRTYSITATVGGMTGGSLTVKSGSGNSVGVISADGTYTFAGVCTGNNSVAFTPLSTFDGYLDDVSVKEVLPIWLPTAANGSQIFPSQMIHTRKGSFAKYDSTFKGFLNEPARTNKVTARKHNPVDTTNLTKAGDAAAVLSVVDDVAALTTAGLIGVCTNGKVYKLDNSAGATAAYVSIGGAVGNTNPHCISAFVRGGAGNIGLTWGEGATAYAAAGAYQLRTSLNKSATAADRLLVVLANAGQVIYFILPQLEEGAFITSPIPGDTLAAVTRAATNYTRPTAGVLRANDWGIWQRVVPSAAGQASTFLWSSRVDVNNRVSISVTATVITFSKIIAGVATSATVNYTHLAGIPFEVQASQSSTGGMKVRVKQDGGSWSAYGTNASVADCPIASDHQIGAVNNTAHFSGHLPFTMLIQHADPKAELERLAALYT